jgi:hypothetical protein
MKKAKAESRKRAERDEGDSSWMERDHGQTDRRKRTQ